MVSSYRTSFSLDAHPMSFVVAGYVCWKWLSGGHLGGFMRKGVTLLVRYKSIKELHHPLISPFPPLSPSAKKAATKHAASTAQAS